MLEVKKGSKNYYIGESEDNVLAEMTFIDADEGFITIDHTMVKEELSGQGAGKLILKEIVDWARKENKKIKPVCPYAKAQMEKNEEYHDMIYK